MALAASLPASSARSARAVLRRREDANAGVVGPAGEDKLRAILVGRFSLARALQLSGQINWMSGRAKVETVGEEVGGIESFGCAASSATEQAQVHPHQ